MKINIKNTYSHLAFDVMIIVVSIAVAVVLVKTQVITQLLDSTIKLEFLGSFIAGMLFTTVFTTAPAIVTLGEMAVRHDPIWIAFFGALGAVCGDLIIFRFVRDRFAEHIMELVEHRSFGKRLHAILRLKSFRWLSFFLGGLIIASPLPDELGIGVISFSKIKTVWFIPLSFVFNFMGILLIGILARAIVY